MPTPTKPLKPLEPDSRELAESNLPLARWHAKKWITHYEGIIAFDDIVSECYLALCVAAQKFDIHRGEGSFATCYRWQLRAAMRNLDNGYKPVGFRKSKYKDFPATQAYAADTIGKLAELSYAMEPV